MKARRAPLALLAAVAPLLCSAGADGRLPLALDVHRFRFVPKESGPVDYYTLVEDASHGPYLHADYEPGMKTAVLAYEIQDDADRRAAAHLRWTWRALALPAGGNECAKGKEDSAAVVYVTWKKFLRYYTLKYVWSSVGAKGAVCDSRRNAFVAQDTVILESGGPLDTWLTEDIDLAAEFRRHFENNDPNAAPPPLGGIGIMSDGDATGSKSSADYGPFGLY